MNIAIFTDTYPPYINGVSTSTYNLVNTLKAHGHKVLTIAPRFTPGPMEMKDDVIYMPGIPVKKLYSYRITKMFDRRIFKYLQEYNIEIVHFQDDATIGQFGKRAAKKLNIPIVYTYHSQYEDYTGYFTRGLMERIAKRLVRWFVRTVSKHPTGYISPSLKSKDYLRQIKTDIHIDIVPTGIDFSLFADDKVDVERTEKFKKKYNIGKDTKVLLLLGRIGPEKSMDVSLRYFAEYRKAHPEVDFRTLVVGGGPQLDYLKLLCSELGITDYVYFLGPVSASEVPFYYHLADIYTSASLTETQGLTFMEAMAAGRTVLARYDDQLVGTIIDGETGFFFTDAQSFIEKVDRALNMPEDYKNYMLSRIKEVLDAYSIDRFYSSIMGVYERALKKFW